MEAQEAWKNFHYNSAGGLGHREGKNNTDTYGAGPMGPAEVRQVQVEHLLGHLAGTVQSFMRHVITPVSGRPVPAASSVGRHKALKKVLPSTTHLQHTIRPVYTRVIWMGQSIRKSLIICV